MRNRFPSASPIPHPASPEILLSPHTTPSQVYQSLFLVKKRSRLNFESVTHPQVAAASVMQVLRRAWASTTLSATQNLLSRLSHFCQLRNLPLTPNTALIFLEATRVSIQARLTYSKSLQAFFNRIHQDTSLFSVYNKGLRAMGALQPLHQATPMSKEDVILIANHLPPSDSAVFLLAWKTASRWSDVQHLLAQNIILRSPEEIIVHWDQQTKSTRTDPYHASVYTVVVGDLTARIFHSLISRHDTPLTLLTTEDITHIMRQVCPNKNYSAHSIKHGAVCVLAQAAAERRLCPTKLSLVAKHKITVSLATMTIRYIQDKVAAARLLGTQEATIFL